MKKFILTESQYKVLLKEMADDISYSDVRNNVLNNPDNGIQTPIEKDLGSFDGWKRVRRKGINKMNLRNDQTGEYISQTWYDFVGSMVKGIAIVIDNNKGVNAIDGNGELLFRSWHEDINMDVNGEEYTIKDGNNIVTISRVDILNNRALNESTMQEIDDASKEVNLTPTEAQKEADWCVYVDGKLDETFTEWIKKSKRKPKIGRGWYCGGTIFKIKKIEGNKIYAEEDK